MTDGKYQGERQVLKYISSIKIYLLLFIFKQQSYINKNRERIQLFLLLNICIEYAETVTTRKLLWMRFRKNPKKHLYWSAIFLSWSATLLKIASHHGWLCETFLEFPEHNFIPRTSCFLISDKGKDWWPLLLLFNVQKARCPGMTMFRTIMFCRISEVIFSCCVLEYQINCIQTQLPQPTLPCSMEDYTIM